MRKLAAGVALLTCLTLPVRGNSAELSFGYNVVENAVLDSGDLRTRMINNIDLIEGDFCFGYHGLNEFNNFDTKTYFGRNRLTIGKKGADTSALIDMRGDVNGVFDTKFGMRNTGLIKKAGGYGFVDVSVNGKAGNVNLFYGRSLGHGLSLEYIQSSDFAFNGKPSYYRELQMNKDVGKGRAVFARAEMTEHCETKYMFGVAQNLF
jgi:hypothetical protein